MELFRTLYIKLSDVFYLPTDAQENCFKRSIKIHLKTAATCFGVVYVLLGISPAPEV